MVDTKKMVYSHNEIGIEMVFINHLRSTMKTISNFPRLHQFVVALVLLATFTALPKFARSQLPCGGGTKGTVTNSGTEFLLVFMENETRDNDIGVTSASYFQNIYIASLSDTAIVTVTCKLYPSFKKVITLPSRTSQVVSLVTAAYPTFIVLSDDLPDRTVVSVTSTAPIVCYGMNHKYATADAFLALPKNVAATAYMAMCYKNSSDEFFRGIGYHPSEFAVAAFEDSTKITIIPSATTMSSVSAGTPIDYTLNAGECVQIHGEVSDLVSNDLTGSLITSNKPISVFSGHRRTELPHDFFWFDDNANKNSSRDHLAEQMPPICAWGKSFIATNFKPRTLGDLVRVLVSENGTVVKVNGVEWCTLNRGQFRDTLIAYSTILTDNIFTVETSQPSLVGSFAHSTNSGSGIGDPFFAVVPPMEQTYNDFTYFISNYSVYTGNNFVVIATEASGAGKISLNGVVQPAASYTPAYTLANGKKYAVATFSQSPGINRATSPNSNENGFTILAYGFGVVDSYGYTAGSLLKPIGCLMNMNNTASSPAPGGSPSLPFFKLRNIMDAPVYVDSVRIRYNSNPEHIYVEAKNMPMTYLPTIGMGEELPLTLIPRSTPTQPISGIATVYTHTGLWIDLVPYELPFTIQAGSTSSVTPMKEHSAQAELYPNPVRTDATLLFTIGAASHVTIEVYDALGRLVTIATDEMMSEGSHSIRLSGSKLPNGTYFFRISVPGLGIAERGEFIVVH